MAMQSALAGLLGMGAPGGAPNAPPNPSSLGIGNPPAMPGLPPAPEMVGQMPTGSTSSNSKQAADVAIASLRDAKGYFPSLGDQIDSLISQFQQAGQAPTPSGITGAPGGPGAALPPTSPTMSSGSPGEV